MKNLSKLSKINLPTKKILLLSIPFLIFISIIVFFIICISPLIFLFFIFKEFSNFIQNYDRRKKQLLMNKSKYHV